MATWPSFASAAGTPLRLLNCIPCLFFASLYSCSSRQGGKTEITPVRRRLNWSAAAWEDLWRIEEHRQILHTPAEMSETSQLFPTHEGGVTELGALPSAPAQRSNQRTLTAKSQFKQAESTSCKKHFEYRFICRNDKKDPPISEVYRVKISYMCAD